ncbi:hypothetical protein AGMMS50293_26410 [Spirochaetia bacterium]|nr:hypothetical protein AGMMS50293_26410 [Spirochaetia bacterium]
MSSFKRPSEIANGINRGLERLMPIIPPLAVVMGFLLPHIFIHLRPLITLLFGLMTYSGALKLRTREFGSVIRHPMPMILCFISIHVIMPLIAMLVSSLFFKGDSDTIAGFILLYSGPTAVSGFIWVSMFRGDPALCLTLILLDTMLAPLVIPGTVSILMGTKVTINMTGIAVSLCLMVVIPTILGVATNELSRGKIPSLVTPYLSPLSKICLAGVIAANSAPIARQLHFDEPRIWGIAALCILLAIISYMLSKLTGIAGRMNPEKQVSIFFAGGLRNISAVTTIAVDFFAQGAVLPALLGIMFQQTLAAVMGRLLMDRTANRKI